MTTRERNYNKKLKIKKIRKKKNTGVIFQSLVVNQERKEAWS